MMTVNGGFNQLRQDLIDNTLPGGGDPPSKKRRRPHEVDYDCIDCGTHVTRIRQSDEPRVCLECGVQRGVKAAIEMHNRSGPAYDRHREAMRRPGQARSTKE